MSRLVAAAAAALLLAPLVGRAQDNKAPAAPAKPAPAASAPVTGNPETDARIQAAIQKAVEKAKEDVRNELRAEIDSAKAGADFMGTVAPGPKLEFLELDGYFRTRGQLLDGLDLGRDVDSAGYYIFPVPLSKGSDGGPATFATANMRLRLEPTLNISENVRVRAQFDILDNYVLGSSANKLMNAPGSPYPVPFYGSTVTYYANEKTQDRDLVLPKRAWGEVQTPVGLLSFGRMPSHWGLGMMTNAGRDIDADYGDSVDRLQFALPPVATPFGALTFVPIIDFDAEGPLYNDPVYGYGSGQPLDATQADDARTYALKVARLDTDDELRRTVEAGRSSYNFGLYYNYKTQRYTYPAWLENGFGGDYTESDGNLKRNGWAHVLNFWNRWQNGKLRIEAEVAGVYGHISDPRNVNSTTVKAVPLDIGQWGGVLQLEYKVLPNKFTLGGELGVASGDSAPGFGNQPNRYHAAAAEGDLPYAPSYGAMEGPQWGYRGDHSINNFRFNPAYTVDMILFRRILGNVTDAWYLRPSLRWDIFPGLTLDSAVIYSQALFSESTPSSASEDDSQDSRLTDRGHKPLGLELDNRISLKTGDGFLTWGEIGLLQPLSGFGVDTSRAWVFNFGFAAKF
ncbi:MAG: TIGR04551 family protein [Anaeromyxobacter sp.]